MKGIFFTQVARIFHSVVAAHLPLSVYAFTNIVFSNSDVAVMAAILTSLSVHLTVFGTHTLINSLLSPFVVFLSAQTIILVQNWGSHRRHVANGMQYDAMPKQTKRCENNNTCSHMYQEKGNDFDELSYIRNTLDLTKIHNSRRTYTQLKIKLFSTGFGISILVYMRLDIVIFMVLVNLPLILLKRTSHRVILPLTYLVLGGLAGLLIGGFVDWVTFGSWFLSPIQWMKFNVLSDRSSILFGIRSNTEYIMKILLDGWFMITFCLVAPFSLVFISIFDRKSSSNNVNSIFKPFYVMSSTVCLLFVIYSVQGHKEKRFLHNVIVLSFVCSAVAILFLVHYFTTYFRLYFIKRRLIFIIILVAAFNLYRQFPTQKDKSNSEWSFLGVWDSGYINECFDFIRRQHDVTGVFSGRGLHMTGGYTTLHRNVPLISLVHYEFQEFDDKSRIQIQSKLWFTSSLHVNVSVVNRASNFVTIDNMQYLVKYLISKPIYNYVVIRKNMKFIKTGFTQVFQAGTMQVLKRRKDEQTNQELNSFGDTIPSLTNGTILEYEGSWLITLGLRRLAQARLKYAIEKDPSRVRAYQLLAIMYLEEGENEKLRSILASCYSRNGKYQCNKPQPKVVLYSDYNIEVY